MGSHFALPNLVLQAVDEVDVHVGDILAQAVSLPDPTWAVFRTSPRKHGPLPLTLRPQCSYAPRVLPSPLQVEEVVQGCSGLGCQRGSQAPPGPGAGPLETPEISQRS